MYKFFFVGITSELDHYLEEKVWQTNTEFDILSWWKTNGFKYPRLQKIARDILAIPISTVASESAFSTSGRLVSPHRSRLHPKTLEALMCAQSWLLTEIRGDQSFLMFTYKFLLLFNCIVNLICFYVINKHSNLFTRD